MDDREKRVHQSRLRGFVRSLLECSLPACFLLAAHVTAAEPKPNPAVDKAAFEKAAAGAAWATCILWSVDAAPLRLFIG